jgi:hypothetical protein
MKIYYEPPTEPAKVIDPVSMPLVINLRTPEERVVDTVCAILAFAGLGWFFLHNFSDIWDIITSRQFFVAVGFSVIANVVLRWGSGQPP